MMDVATNGWIDGCGWHGWMNGSIEERVDGNGVLVGVNWR